MFLGNNYQTSPDVRRQLRADLRCGRTALSQMDGTRAEALLDMRDHVLAYAFEANRYHEGAFHITELMDAVKDFKIQYDYYTVTFTDPVTGQEVCLDLLKLQNPEQDPRKVQPILQKVEALYQLKGIPFGTPSLVHNFVPASKGNRAGAVPLQKSEQSNTGKLPKDFADVRAKVLPRELEKFKEPAPQHGISKKHALLLGVNFAEFFHEKLKAEIPKKIQTKKDEIARIQGLADFAANPNHHAEVVRLNKEIVHLTHMEEEIKKFDAYAFTMALTANGRNIAESRAQVQERVQADLKDTIPNRRFESLQSKFFAKPGLTPHDEEYARDVSDLLFTTRAQYAHHCRRVANETGREYLGKKESVTDLFLRETMAFKNNGLNYKATGFKNSLFFTQDLSNPRAEQGFSPELKTELGQMLDNIAHSAMQQLPKVPAPVVNADERQAAMDVQSAHQAIDFQAPVVEAPVPLPQPSVVATVARSSVVPLLATAAMVGAYTMYQHMYSGLSYDQTSAGLAAAAVYQAAAPVLSNPYSYVPSLSQVGAYALAAPRALLTSTNLAAVYARGKVVERVTNRIAQSRFGKRFKRNHPRITGVIGAIPSAYNAVRGLSGAGNSFAAARAPDATWGSWAWNGGVGLLHGGISLLNVKGAWNSWVQAQSPFAPSMQPIYDGHGLG